LSSHLDQLEIRIDGRPATLGTALRSGDVVQVDRPSGVEPVVAAYRFTTSPGLPDVERALWHPGRSALEQDMVGSFSGEVQSQSIVGPPVSGQPVTDKVVALTFDDGPDPRWTPMVLQILADEGVPATFCLVGIHVQAYPQLVRAELAQHETLCDHTLDHDVHLDRAPPARIAHEVNGGADAIAAATGVQVSFYRPPGGSLSPAVINLAHERGLRVLYWTVDPVDYLRPPPEVLFQRILAGVRPGAIILLHDGFSNDRSHTVAILRPLIDTLRAQGYGFTTPDALRPADTPPDQAQATASSTGLAASGTR
jgi:peptidoglycan/xylan/chitin deacetylase (PgdA/CDA1 family)